MAGALISQMVEQRTSPDARTIDSCLMFCVSNVQKLLLFVETPKVPPPTVPQRSRRLLCEIFAVAILQHELLKAKLH